MQEQLQEVERPGASTENATIAKKKAPRAADFVIALVMMAVGYPLMIYFVFTPISWLGMILILAGVWKLGVTLWRIAFGA